MRFLALLIFSSLREAMVAYLAAEGKGAGSHQR